MAKHFLPPITRNRFNAALAYRGVTKRAWTREHEVTEQHLDVVLKGEREVSVRLAELIEDTIHSYERSMFKHSVGARHQA